MSDLDYAPRVHEDIIHGVARRRLLSPAKSQVPRLVAELADVWVEVAAETKSCGEIATAVNNFTRHVAGQLQIVRQADAFGLESLRVRHLDAWERDLMVRARREGTEAAYRLAINLFALLKRIENDRPGVLDVDLTRRVSAGTRLRTVTAESRIPDYPPDELRALRRVAYKQIAASRPGVDRATPTLMVALAVMISLGTGEPPEVIRDVYITDLRLTQDVGVVVPDSLDELERMAWLVEHDAVKSFAVEYNKNRAHEQYERVYERANRTAYMAFKWLLERTAPLRSTAGPQTLFVVESESGAVELLDWSGADTRLGTWLAGAGLELSGPARFGRIRKGVVTKEALQSPIGYLVGQRRHRSETFYRSYTNSRILRAQAGQILTDAVDDLFEAATQGPTIVTPDAERALADGVEALDLDAATAQRFVAGELDGPHAACRDPLDSPFERGATPCSKSMTGLCAICRNSLIGKRHLPAQIAIAEWTDPARAGNLGVWSSELKFLYDTVTTVILPAFDPKDVEEARARIASVPVAIGIRNGLRDPQ